MNYLDVDDLRLIYLRVQLESSSSFTIPDKDKLKSIVDIPKQTIGNKEIYPTIYSKAAAITFDCKATITITRWKG